jgi:nucleotide sugar dehydrogenase
MMNELAELCNLLDIDLWNAIDCAASKPFGYQAFYPGPGVGGHCIPIDPNYLSHHVKAVLGRPFRFVELAQEINSGMPSYVFRRIQDALNDHAKALRGSRVLLLGVTYKANIADERESPARPLARALIDAGADVTYFDPYVAKWNVDSEHGLHEGDRVLSRPAGLDAAVADSDIVIVLQNHSAFDFDSIIGGAKLMLDTRGKLEGANVIRM